ncbi:MAG: thioesterase family protein [Chloroflexi bacterium]|nr:thioesterase family protein [Chloroflexota bacterium]
MRSYEVDRFGHVNNAVYLNYLEEAATRASASVGFDNAWYEANQCMWVIREMHVRYHEPALYGDELEIRTWVSDFRRVRSHREYEIVRVHDDCRILRGRADWVFVDRTEMKPKRLLPEFEDAFQPANNPLEDLGIRIPAAKSYDTHHFVSERRAQCYEIDQLGHVNNANYLRWVEQAYFDALASVGWSIIRLQSENFVIFSLGHALEYFHEAKEGDSIKIVSWAAEKSRVRGAWIHEMYNRDTGELLARDYAAGAFLSKNGDTYRPVQMPDALTHAIVTGERT